MRIGDVLNLHLKFGYQIYVYLVSSLVGLVFVCHYVCRIQYLMAAYYWRGGTRLSDGTKEDGICGQVKKEWGANEKELWRHSGKLRNESIKMRMFSMLQRVICKYTFASYYGVAHENDNRTIR